MYNKKRLYNMTDPTTSFFSALFLKKGLLFIIGGIGGLITVLLTPPRDRRPLKTIVTVLAGAMCAALFTPWLMYYFMLDQQTESALAFVIGISGMNVVTWILKTSGEVLQNPAGLIRAFFKK